MIVLAVAGVAVLILWAAFGDVVLWSLLAAGVVVAAAGAVFAVWWCRRTVPQIRQPWTGDMTLDVLKARELAEEHPVKVIEGVFEVSEERLPARRKRAWTATPSNQPKGTHAVTKLSECDDRRDRSRR